MAIELALRSLLEGKEANILEILKELRCSRACSVQNEGQYIFIHFCLIEYVKAKKVARTEAAEFATQYALYKKMSETQKAAEPQTPPVRSPDVRK